MNFFSKLFWRNPERYARENHNMSELSGFHRNQVANPIPQKVLETANAKTAKNLDKSQALKQ